MPARSTIVSPAAAAPIALVIVRYGAASVPAAVSDPVGETYRTTPAGTVNVWPPGQGTVPYLAGSARVGAPVTGVAGGGVGLTEVVVVGAAVVVGGFAVVGAAVVGGAAVVVGTVPAGGRT